MNNGQELNLNKTQNGSKETPSININRLRHQPSPFGETLTSGKPIVKPRHIMPRPVSSTVSSTVNLSQPAAASAKEAGETAEQLKEIDEALNFRMKKRRK